QIYYAYNCGNSCIMFCNSLVLVIVRSPYQFLLCGLSQVLHHLLWLLFLFLCTTDTHSYLLQVHTLLTLSSLYCDRTSFSCCVVCVRLSVLHTCQTILVLFA